MWRYVRVLNMRAGKIRVNCALQDVCGSPTTSRSLPLQNTIFAHEISSRVAPPSFSRSRPARCYQEAQQSRFQTTSLMLDTRSGYLPLEGHDPSSLSGEIVNTQYNPVCTVVDLLVLLCFSVQFRPFVPPDAVHAELHSSYINLDVLYSKGTINSSHHAPIVNHAFSFVQVSLTDPDKVLPTYHTAFSEQQFGPVPLVERRLLVTPQISTVAQFRAMDFGMELCTLAVGVPTLNESDGQVMSPPSFMLDVYTLPIRERLKLRAFSYSSLPGLTTKTLFAQLELSEGTIVQTPRFPCRTLSYHTFFLACSHPDCHLDLIRSTYDESGKPRGCWLSQNRLLSLISSRSLHVSISDHLTLAVIGLLA
ncbi:hypothetical protein OG21DRAFT_612143 [Imleria badia]|nr:hypothetical protein OG21DRAFT_612143 [Imleria badia]